jgi:hypothetical protein
MTYFVGYMTYTAETPWQGGFQGGTKMALPAEIERIKQATEALEAELYQPSGDKPQTPVADTPPPAIEPVPEPPPIVEPATPAPAEPPPEPTPEPTLEPAPAPAPADWKHKYDVLQGKYNKEVPRLAENVRASNDAIISLRDENSKLITEVAELRRTVVGTPRPDSTPDPVIDADPDVSFLRDQYPDVSKAVVKLVRAGDGEVQKQLAALNQTLTQVLTETKATKGEKFYNTLDEKVKNWEEVNDSVEFRAWLNKPDRYSGQPRAILIKNAADRLDANTTVNFFEDFLAETAPARNEPVVPTTPRKPANLHPPRPSTTKIPERPPAEPQKEIITTAQVTAFYEDIRRGKFVGREAERDKLEAEVDLAAAEGRIR